GPRTPTSAPRPRRAIEHRRGRTATDAHRRPPRRGSKPPKQPGTDLGPGPRLARTRSPAPDAAEPAVGRGDRAAVHKPDANWRTPAPSPTPPRPPGRRTCSRPSRSGTAAGPSYRSLPPPTGPATDLRRGGYRPPTRPAARTRRTVREEPGALRVRQSDQ